MTIVNPTLPLTSLLRPAQPSVYRRNSIYDPMYDDPSYGEYQGTRIVPAVGSLVQDSDDTPLWVIAIDPVTYIPTYTAVPLSTENDNVVSLLNYGNSTLRLYVDYRHIPYPASPDSKCIFIGKSPRFYTLSRYPRTANETIISQYYSSTGQLQSQMVPLTALDDTNTSWYLQRANISQILDDGEEIEVKIYNEDGQEVYSAILFAKESAVINEDVMYAPTIVGMTISGNQRLSNGTFFLYEKQDFNSLGIQATLVYDDGSTAVVPIDGLKCILYGQNDFISSFSGLLQYVTVKYFRSENESIDHSLSDATGQMISATIPVTVIPNTLGTTVKIMAMPNYNATTSRYVMRYYMYYGDGRSFTDVSGYVSIVSGALITDSSHFGISQTYTVGVDMHNVDPTNYPTSTLYQQTIVITFGAPGGLVKWTIRDANTSPYIYGQDNTAARRPSLRFDSTISQYFIPSYIFGNTAAFLNSFYTMAAPPYDPSVSDVPQVPTHFILRDLVSGNMVISAPISVDSYASAFNIIGDTTGNYLNSTIVFEFINTVSQTVKRTLFGVPVNVSSGAYISPT